MTTKLQRRNKALADVRGAIHGWAFSLPECIPGMIAMAEDARDRLPDDLKEEADRLIEPLRTQ